MLGQATWQAANGELIGTPTSPEGGWLVLNKGLEDFQFGADLKRSAECKAGVLVRARRQPDGGLTRIFVLYGVGDAGLSMVTLDASGRETTRSPLEGGSIGNMVRYAPLPVDPNAPERGRGSGRGEAPAAGAPAAGAIAPAAPGAPTGPPTAAGGPGRAGFPGGAPPAAADQVRSSIPRTGTMSVSSRTSIRCAGCSDRAWPRHRPSISAHSGPSRCMPAARAKSGIATCPTGTSV